MSGTLKPEEISARIPVINTVNLQRKGICFKQKNQNVGKPKDTWEISTKSTVGMTYVYEQESKPLYGRCVL